MKVEYYDGRKIDDNLKFMNSGELKSLINQKQLNLILMDIM